MMSIGAQMWLEIHSYVYFEAILCLVRKEITLYLQVIGAFIPTQRSGGPSFHHFQSRVRTIIRIYNKQLTGLLSYRSTAM